MKDSKRRMASYETLGLTEPLVVFAPKEIESLLFQKLKSHFEVCGYGKNRKQATISMGQ